MYPKKSFHTKSEARILQADIDFIEPLIEECLYCLTEGQVQWILSQLNYAGWATRWTSDSPYIDTDWIESFRDDLGRRLMMACCPDDTIPIPPQYRFSETGELEISFDGGETWQDGQDYDYRETVVQMPPPSGADTEAVKCKAANNLRYNMLNTRDEAAGYLGTSSTIIELVTYLATVLLAFLGLGAVAQTLFTILMGLGTYIWSLTPEDLIAAVGDDELDILRCLAYCYSDDQGRYSDSAFGQMRAQLSTDITDPTANYFFDTILNAIGSKGLGNLGALGNQAATGCDTCDCEDEWCHVIDFTVSDGGFSAVSGFTPLYVSSVGWKAQAPNPGVVYIERTITSATVTEVRITTTVSAPQGGGALRSPFPVLNGTPGALVNTWAVNLTGTLLTLAVDSNYSGASNPVWNGAMVEVQFRGTGTNPFGSENCEE